MTKNGSGTGEPLMASRKGKPKPKGGDVFLSPDERKDTEAIAITSASYAAYRVIATTEANPDTPDLLSMIRRLNTRSAAVIGGDMAEAEAMLMSQATALQSLFARLVERAVMQEHMPNLEGFMRMALRAQSQCRATLETLATIKNPRSRIRRLFTRSRRTLRQDTSKLTTAALPLRKREKSKPSKHNFWKIIMANGWTPERRARQAVLIKQWRPWEKSTGPKSEEGKQRSAMRGYKGGVRAWLRETAKELRKYAEGLKRVG